MKVGIMLVTVTLSLSVTAATAGPGAFGAKRGLPPPGFSFKKVR